MKKIVIFGGGTGLSAVLSGLKLFPMDVTAVITVSDDGSSTGVLKEELDIPAVGDLGKVLLSMANVDDDFIDLLGYRFQSEGSLHNHPVRNILLAALIDLKGDLTSASKYMCRLLQVRGTVLPLSEEKVELIGHGKREDYIGEVEVSGHIRDIDYLSYDHPITVRPEIVDRIREADLIIFSPGSLYTSIIPHLISPTIIAELEKSPAPIMYLSNLVSQPGETDGYSVSDHVAVLNRYLGSRHVDVVVANNGGVEDNVAGAYRGESKTIVELDMEDNVIADDLIVIDESGSIRHDTLKTAYLGVSYLMRQPE